MNKLPTQAFHYVNENFVIQKGKGFDPVTLYEGSIIRLKTVRMNFNTDGQEHKNQYRWNVADFCILKKYNKHFINHPDWKKKSTYDRSRTCTDEDGIKHYGIWIENPFTLHWQWSIEKLNEMYERDLITPISNEAFNELKNNGRMDMVLGEVSDRFAIQCD